MVLPPPNLEEKNKELTLVKHLTLLITNYMLLYQKPRTILALENLISDFDLIPNTKP